MRTDRAGQVAIAFVGGGRRGGLRVNGSVRQHRLHRRQAWLYFSESAPPCESQGSSAARRISSRAPR